MPHASTENINGNELQRKQTQALSNKSVPINQITNIESISEVQSSQNFRSTSPMPMDMRATQVWHTPGPNDNIMRNTAASNLYDNNTGRGTQDKIVMQTIRE